MKGDMKSAQNTPNVAQLEGLNSSSVPLIDSFMRLLEYKLKASTFRSIL